MTSYNLVQFDLDTKKPIYTKFNFDFNKYNTDFNINSNDKNIIFADFWNRNEFDYSNQYNIKDELIQYFTPITEEIINYIDAYCFIHDYYVALIKPDSFIDKSDLLKDQFELKYYTDNQVRRL